MHSAKPESAKPAIDLLSEENHCAACRDALTAAAHELKTPLAIMGGYLHLLLTQKLGPLTPQQLEVLSEMQDNGARLTNFIQNVLTYATLKVDRYEMQYEVATSMPACAKSLNSGCSASRTRRLHFISSPTKSCQPFLSIGIRCSTSFRTCSTTP